MNKQESERSFSVLEGAYLNERPKALLAFAKDNGLLECSISAPSGESFPATQYCMMLYCNAAMLEQEHHLLEQFYGSDAGKPEFQNMMQDAFQIVSLLLTMERMRCSFWNFGSEIRYKVAAAGIRLTRNEINSFLAQQGSFSRGANKPDKGALMRKNPLAVSIYAAELLTTCGSLLGILHPSAPIPQALYEKFSSCWRETPKESLETMMLTFCPAFLGTQEPQLKPFMDFLADSDFYYAPASTKYHGNFPTGLASHNCLFLARLVAIVKPQTEAELGKLVLTTIGHDLCKVNVYRSYFTNDKIDGPAMRKLSDGTMDVDKYQTKRWSNGSEYHYEEVQKYAFDDKLPQGHGQKSLNMIVGYFPASVTEDMAAAIDGHMRDVESNPLCDYQMMHYPLCQYLHIADVMASMLDEEGGI